MLLKAILFDRPRGRSPEIAIEVARQAGKTTAVVDTVEFLMIFYPLAAGIFAPQREQAKTDFDRLKDQLAQSQRVIGLFEPEESNANTLKVDNDAECYIFPITETSNPESKTLDLIIVEEAQHINDRKFNNAVRPMGASTNAVIVFIGTAAHRICHFYRLLQRNHDTLILDSDVVIADRRAAYEADGDPTHLRYETYVHSERERFGEDSDEYQIPYKLVWKLGGGQFTTMEALDALVGKHSRVYQDKQTECFAGIDTAKNPDATVVTILRLQKIKNSEGQIVERKKQLVNWLRLRGENYKDQFDVITDTLRHYNVQAIAIDSTGQGDFMPDMFERETEWRDENSGLYRVKFSLVSKDAIYKNLDVVIRNLLTTIPKIETKEAEEFRQQMLDLIKEWKGQLLSCHHPDSNDAHDDYPDSWALAEWAYALWNRTADMEIRFV